MKTDMDRVVAARKGDKEAFIQLVEPFEHKLYQTALGILGSKYDAEDAWQNTVLQAWRGIRGLREPLFKTWLTRILLNEAKQILRKRVRFPELKAELPDVAEREQDIPAKLLALSCLQILGHDQREAVILRFWLDLTLEEMADAMHVPLSTAKTRLYQGLSNLRSNLREVDLHE